LVQAFLKKWWVESDFKAPNLPKKFIFRYQDLVEIYSVSAEKIISDAFSYSENVITIKKSKNVKEFFFVNVMRKNIIYDSKIEVVPLIINFSTELTTVVKFEV
jgi:hypothetical protein